MAGSVIRARAWLQYRTVATWPGASAGAGAGAVGTVAMREVAAGGAEPALKQAARRVMPSAQAVATAKPLRTGSW